MNFSNLVHSITNVQTYLQNEKLLQELKSSVNSKEINENQEEIKKILRNLKKYWLGQFLIKMERKYKNTPNKFRFPDKNYNDFFFSKEIYGWYEMKDAQKECLQKLDTNSFKSFCLSLQPSEIYNDFINFISLSVAPSIYNFFISAKKNMFIELVFEILNFKIKKKFLKTIFLIPSFINFVSNSFHPIIMPFENKEMLSFVNSKSIIESLLESWIKNMNLCPKLIRKYFQSLGNQDICIEELLVFFKQCFKYPSNYQITYFYNSELPPTFYEENNTNRILNFLNENRNYLKKFVLSLFGEISIDISACENQNNDEDIISYRDDFEDVASNDEFSDVFLPDTFYSYDINFLNDAISKSFDTTKFTPIKELFENECKFFILPEIPTNIALDDPSSSLVTSVQLDSFKKCFVSLLENSEILPAFPDSYLQEKDPEFIENFLVNRGPISNLSKRKRLYSLLKSFSDDPLKKLSKMDFDELMNENNSQNQKDENFYDVAYRKNIIFNIHRITNPIENQFFHTLQSNYLIKKFNGLPMQKNLTEDVNDLIKDPKKLKELFDYYNSHLTNNDEYWKTSEFWPESNYINFIFSQNSFLMLYKTKKLTFDKFLNVRSELSTLDESFMQMVSSRKIEENSMFKKMKKVITHLNFYGSKHDDADGTDNYYLNDKFDRLSQKLLKAFSSYTNPIQKIIDISNSFMELQQFFLDESGEDVERGDIVVIRDLLLTIVPPKTFVSAMVFMFDYYFLICDAHNKLRYLFEQMYDIAFRNTKHCINDSLNQHLFIHRKQLKITFLGDDSNNSTKKKIFDYRIDGTFSPIQGFVANSKEIYYYYYLKDDIYYVCEVDVNSDMKDQIDLAIFAFDDDEKLVDKINEAKKEVRNRFTSYKFVKEFTYIVSNESSHKNLKNSFSEKLIDFTDNVMSRIIDNYIVSFDALNK